MIAIKKGTTSWRATVDLGADEVEFVGTFRYETDGFTPAMVWDDALQNVRLRNAVEQTDRDEEIAAAVAQNAQAITDRAALRTQYQSDLDALQAIRDFSGTVTLAIVGQGLKTIAVVLIHVLKALKAVV